MGPLAMPSVRLCLSRYVGPILAAKTLCVLRVTAISFDPVKVNGAYPKGRVEGTSAKLTGTEASDILDDSRIAKVAPA